MTKPTHVLAVTDLSEGSDEAVRQASGYARVTGARLSVLHVVPDWMRANLLIPDGSARETNLEIAMEQRALDDLVARVQEVTGRPREDVEIAVRAGSVDAAVVRYSEEKGVDVVVVGATGRTGLSRLLLGSTAERVVRHAHCSVLVARPSPETNVVLAATDLSEAAVPAVQRAREEAEWRGAKLHVVHAMDFSALGWAAAAGPLGGFAVPIPPAQMAEMRRLAEEALHGIAGPDAVIHVVEGSPKKAIATTAESLPASLVVVGTHGRTGLARMALGSVAEAITRVVPCSVLVVRK
jgi:nucleotide-binding universal stress UspA family protein